MNRSGRYRSVGNPLSASNRREGRKGVRGSMSQSGQLEMAKPFIAVGRTQQGNGVDLGWPLMSCLMQKLPRGVRMGRAQAAIWETLLASMAKRLSSGHDGHL